MNLADRLMIPGRESGKILGWMMLVVVVLLGVLAAYWHFNPAQQPGWVATHLPVVKDAEVELYRWQDTNGEWTLSSEQPPEGVEFEVVSYRHDTNVMPAIEQVDED